MHYRPPTASHGASIISQSLQGGAKAQASGADQGGAENLRPVIRIRPRKPAGDFLAAGQRSCERIRQRRVLIGSELAFPGPITHGVGADRPEIGTAADQRTVPEHDHSAVAALHAVKHMHVERIKPIPHCKYCPLREARIQPGDGAVEPRHYRTSLWKRPGKPMNRHGMFRCISLWTSLVFDVDRLCNVASA